MDYARLAHNMSNVATNETIGFGNDTLFESSPELECYLSLYEQEYPRNGLYCNTTWDGLSCWPLTKSATSAVIPCFNVLNGVLYDSSKNASRECYNNGTWANKSDYSSCKPLAQQDDNLEVLWEVKEAATIYYVGYGLSLIALSVALWIFLYFKDLRCLRNTIHTNLMVTYLFIDLTWIITASLQSSTSADAHKAACVLVILLTYLMGTNFFWMFVEGLYLYILVVKTFSVENVKWQVYAAIGWGLPAVVVIVWTAVKARLTHMSGESPVAPSPVVGCPWQNRDNYDYIFICPVLLVLLINIFFLGQIMWVLITKLRAATSLESKQYRKAAKALLVLIPLLGVTYIVVIVTPSHRTARVIFSYAQAALLSTQGFTVAVLYCFFNGEVRKSVRHHFEQWKDSRGLNKRRQSHRNSRNGDGAFRLYTNRGVRDRASCISLSTSGTWLSTNYKCQSGTGQRPSNGSYSPVPIRDDCV